jgi:hypothetical protein
MTRVVPALIGAMSCAAFQGCTAQTPKIEGRLRRKRASAAAGHGPGAINSDRRFASPAVGEWYRFLMGAMNR